VYGLFAAAAARHALLTALIDARSDSDGAHLRLSFAEVATAVSHVRGQIHRTISDAGNGSPFVAVTLLPRSPLLAVAVLACCAEGVPWLLVDPSVPAAFTVARLRSAGVSIAEASDAPAAASTAEARGAISKKAANGGSSSRYLLITAHSVLRAGFQPGLRALADKLAANTNGRGAWSALFLDQFQGSGESCTTTSSLWNVSCAEPSQGVGVTPLYLMFTSGNYVHQRQQRRWRCWRITCEMHSRQRGRYDCPAAMDVES
jgi:acyl-coenzyme A synthetase/AMP-(fatty) acid ligase